MDHSSIQDLHTREKLDRWYIHIQYMPAPKNNEYNLQALAFLGRLADYWQMLYHGYSRCEDEGIV